MVYLDDGLGMGPNVQKAQQLAHKIRSDIGLAGFVANETKSQWQPKLSCQWLGFLLDTENRLIHPIPRKTKIIVDMAEQFSNSDSSC